MNNILTVFEHIKRPVLPKEHGAWLILIVSLLSGAFAIQEGEPVWWGGFFLIAIATMFGFMSFTPLKHSLYPPSGSEKGRYVVWLIIYTLVAGACFIAVVAGYRLFEVAWFILPATILSAVYFRSNVAKIQRSLTVEIMGIFGLALAAPASSLVQEREISSQAIVLYLLLVIWFIDRMLTARRNLEVMRSGKIINGVSARFNESRTPLTFHVLALVIVSIISLATLPMGLLATVPFLSATVRNILDTAGIFTFEDPMKVGFAEMRLGFLFCMLTILIWRFY